MSKKQSYLFKGTKGDIARIARSLPPNGKDLLLKGWEDVSHPMEIASGRHTYREPESGLTISYDKSVPGAPGFKGKDHYHIKNPQAHSNKDLYLDKDGNPCSNHSKVSHILPHERKQ